jgi:hypothetical protein
MVTKNRKFNTILLAGLFFGGAVALGYACGGDDTTGPAVPTTTGGSAGMLGTGSGGGGAANTGGGGASNTGGGGAASTEGGAGTAGSAMPCTAAGSYDNKPLNLPADGGLPAL